MSLVLDGGGAFSTFQPAALTETYWSVDGVSLQNLAYNISTLAGRIGPGPLRGSDIVIPNRPGEIWTPKTAGARVLTLSMWVRGYDASGVAGAIQSDQFDDNWRTLLRLLWTPGRQFSLSKRFRVNGVTRIATAKGEYNGGMQPTMIGRRGAKFSVEVKLADPYFYDEDIQITNLVNGHQNVTIPGDADTYNIEIDIAGARTNANIMNWTTESYVEYHDILLSGAAANLDIYNYQALTTPSGGTAYDSSAKVIHSGSAQWFTLKPGVNDLQLASGSGLGLTQIKSRGAWL